MIDKIKIWYQGKPINAVFKHGSSFNPIIIGYERHWTSTIINYLFEFWMRRWVILLPVIIGAIVALFIHFDTNTNSAGNTKQKENHKIISINHKNTLVKVL